MDKYIITKPGKLLISAGYCWDPIEASIPSKSIVYCRDRKLTAGSSSRPSYRELRPRRIQQKIQPGGHWGRALGWNKAPYREAVDTLKYKICNILKSFLANPAVIMLCWVMIRSMLILGADCRHVYIYMEFYYLGCINSERVPVYCEFPQCRR